MLRGRRARQRIREHSDASMAIEGDEDHAVDRRLSAVTVETARSIALPSPVRTSEDLRETAADYVRVHKSLEHTVLPHLPVVDPLAVACIFEGLGVSSPTTFATPHDLFESFLSLSAIGATTSQAWVTELASSEARVTALVIHIEHPVIPKVLIACRVASNRYMGYYCDPSVIEGWLLPDGVTGTDLSSRVRSLIEQLTVSGFGRADALQELQGLGDEAVDDLILALHDPDPDIRANVTQAMENLTPERVVPALVEALQDESALVRNGAATALGKLGDPQAIEPLTDALQRESDKHARDGAEYALKRLTNGKSTERPRPEAESNDAAEAVEFGFRMLREMDSVATRTDVESKYEAVRTSWAPADLYEGTEDEIQALATSILQSWAKRSDVGEFIIRQDRDPGRVDIFARRIDENGETVAMFPSTIWRTKDCYFAFGNTMFRRVPSPPIR
jgi:hypothetical protein